jgi:hypothetical protein
VQPIYEFRNERLDRLVFVGGNRKVQPEKMPGAESLVYPQPQLLPGKKMSTLNEHNLRPTMYELFMESEQSFQRRYRSPIIPTPVVCVSYTSRALHVANIFTFVASFRGSMHDRKFVQVTCLRLVWRVVDPEPRTEMSMRIGLVQNSSRTDVGMR